MPQDWFAQFDAATPTPGAVSMDARPSGWKAKDESAFRNWYLPIAKANGLDLNPDAPEHHYNYRMAFKAGAQPGADGHWPSEFKDATHPNRFVDGVDTITGQPQPKADDFFAQFEPAKAPEKPARDLIDRVSDSVSIPTPFGQMPGGVVLGAGKELLAQGVRGGALLRQIPGVDALSNALPNLNNQVPVSAMTPEGGAERTGAVGLQVAESIAPARAISNAGVQVASKLAPTLAPVIGNAAARLLPRVGVEAAAGGGLSALQGGSAAAGAALGGAIPAIGAGASALASKVAPELRAAAEQQVQQALGATKERFKAMAAKITPEMLRRGMRGSREALKTQAEDMLAVVGPQVDDALKQFGDRIIGTGPVMDALELAKDAYRGTRQVTSAQIALDPSLAEKVRGFVSPGIFTADVVHDTRPIEQLSKLQSVIAEYGESMRADQIVAVRRAWDKVVAGAGGYAQRAAGAIGQPLADQSEAWAKREATTAIRSLLDEKVPELATINKEFSFWKTLDSVLDQTMSRTAPQSKGLAQTVAEVAGAGFGAAASGGHSALATLGTAAVTGKLSGMLKSAFQSPSWKLASAQAKNALAEAITSGSVSKAATILGRLGTNRGAALTQGERGVTIYSNRPGMAIPGSSTGVPE